MASYSFKLKNPNILNSESLIYLQIAFKVGDKFENLKFSTGQKISPKNWNQKEQTAKRKPELNELLKELRNKADNIVLHAKNNGIYLTKVYIKEKWNESKNIPAPVIKVEFLEAYDKYLISLKQKVSKLTISNKNTALTYFKLFSKFANIPLTFENISMSFYDKFLDYCFDEKGIGRNYAGSMVKQLKAFLNWATDEDYNTNMNFKKKAFKKLSYEPTIIYLTESERYYLYNKEIEDKYLSDTRDFFCFGCFTGLRFGDIKRLTKSNIIPKELVMDNIKQTIDFIEIRTQKTDETISQPLNKYSKEILDKHKGNNNLCFNVDKADKTNEALKSLFKLVEMDRMIQKTKFIGSEKIITNLPLHDIITFHISKKTYMTNFLKNGGTLITAMEMTGNKDYKTAKRYIKVVDDLKAIESLKVFN